jgi:hypothetical protein
MKLGSNIFGNKGKLHDFRDIFRNLIVVHGRKVLRTLSLLMLVPLVLATITSCATRQRMAYEDLIRLQLDCKNKDAQIRFLKTQLTTPGERAIAAFNSTSVLAILGQHLNGTYEDNQRIYKRQYDATAKGLIWEARTHC